MIWLVIWEMSLKLRKAYPLLYEVCVMISLLNCTIFRVLTKINYILFPTPRRLAALIEIRLY